MMSNNHKLKVFSGRANRALAERIANNLGDTLGRIVLDNFPDGEIKRALLWAPDFVVAREK